MVRLSLPLLAAALSLPISMAQQAHPARANHRRLAHALAERAPVPQPEAAPTPASAPGLAFSEITLEERAGAPINESELTSVSTESITVSTPGQTSASSTSQAAVTTSSSAAATTSSAASSSVVQTTSSTTSSTAAATTVTTTSTSTPSTTSTTSTTAAATTPTTLALTTSSTSSTVTPTLLGTATTGKNTGTVASHSAGSTYSAAALSSTAKTGGLSKTGLIAIIVVSVVVALGLAWTLFRKLVLKPSRKHRTRRGRGRANARPVDFTPGGLPDPFFEKTRRRPSQDSVSSADRQRRQFVSELEHDEHGAAPGYPPLVDGIPAHDFTAGPASSYAPYGEAHEMQYAPNGGYATDPALGQGYADLHRGPSDGAAYAPHPHQEYHDAYGGHQDYGAPMPMGMDPHAAQQQGLPYAAYGGAPEDAYGQHLQHPQHHEQDMYHHQQPEGLGRPTQGEGPYMIASQAGYGGR